MIRTHDADGEIDTLNADVDLNASPAAAVNLLPVGTHDTSAIPDLLDINGEVHGDSELLDD